ncbi:phage late control D family protein [Pasteurella oralis]|uniref:Phage late control D family protein n=1 Tax=Pasteurella oralis TaxID=1071947 RepID=A0ABW4NTK2_9PAST
MANVPQPDFSLFYEKTNITAEIEPHLIEMSYTDHLEGQSDELTVRFEDIHGKWIRQWFPTQGDKLYAAIGYKAAQLVDIGAFEIDEVEYQYQPATITLRALSAGMSTNQRTLKPHAYENTTLAQIVETVANRLKLKVVGEIKAIPIKRITQYQESDLQFLLQLSKEYHHSFKVVGEQLVFTAKTTLSQTPPILTIEEQDVISLSLRDKLKDTAKEVNISGYNSESKRVLKQTQKAKAKREDITQSAKTSEDSLQIVTRGESQEQINARGEAALAQQNEDQQVGDITLIGNPKLVAGNSILLRNLGVFSGKYLIKSSRHTLSKQGYTTNIEVRLLAFIADDLVTQAMENTYANP